MLPEAENVEAQLNDATALLETEEPLTTEEPEKKATDIVVTEPTPPKDEDQSEKSRLGRKVKRLESTLDEIRSTLSTIAERTAVSSQVVEEPEPELPENATSDEIRAWATKREERLLRKVEKKEEEKRTAARLAQQNYGREYVKAIEETVNEEDDPELYSLLTDTKDLTYNQVHTGNPTKDFAINLKKATDSLRNKKPKPNVHGKPTKVATGANIPNNTPPKKTYDRTKLDPLEQQAAKLFSDEELASILEGK